MGWGLRASPAAGFSSGKTLVASYGFSLEQANQKIRRQVISARPLKKESVLRQPGVFLRRQKTAPAGVIPPPASRMG